MLCVVAGRAAAQDTAAVAAEPRRSFPGRVADSLVAFATAPAAGKNLSWRAVAVPAALVSTGTIIFNTRFGDEANLFGRRFAAVRDADNRTQIDDFTLAAPAAILTGFHIAGYRGANNTLDAGAMYMASVGLAYGIVVPIKHLTAQTRPDSSDLLSFPSGHTAVAFAGAEALRQEYRGKSPWIGAAGYGAAILTGYLRMYNNKHWISDVAAGAGVGILSARIVYWGYPRLKGALTKRGVRAMGTLVPTYYRGAVGFAATWSW